MGIIAKIHTVYQVCFINASDLLSWEKILAQGFGSVSDLLDFLELPLSTGSLLAEQTFRSRIPLGFAKRMQKRNAFDPLLLQVLAQEAELLIREDYAVDPLDEYKTNPVKGLIHKYHGRVLLTLTGVCAINCRFCFRRHFPYQDNNPGRKGFKAICDYIAHDSSISEVILSGGDPFMASNSVLSELISQLENIGHVHTLRVHTRLPVVLPERMDEGLLSLLKATPLKKVLVLHCNHAQELNDLSVENAIEGLRQSDCHLLNQAVLLAGVNDEPQILAELSQALFRLNVLPYYLHVLDKVQGTAHFDVPLLKTQQIYQALQRLLPGYLLPRLVREEPGKPAKTLLSC